MKKGKTSTKDITSSPYFTAVMLLIVIFMVIGVIVWYILDINSTKQELVEVRKSYVDNVNQVKYLEELRAKSEEAEAKLKYYEGILPEELGDAYVLEENLKSLCESFGLEVTAAEDIIQLPSHTQETTYTMTVKGEYGNIISLCEYISKLTQIHRIDSFTLNKDEKGNYISTIGITVLSQNGATGVNLVDAVTN